MFFIRGKSHLPADEGKAGAKLQQELLQMVDDAALQLAFRIFRQLLQAKKFQYIRVFDYIFRCLNLLSLQRQTVNLILIRTKGKALIKRTIVLPLQLR